MHSDQSCAVRRVFTKSLIAVLVSVICSLEARADTLIAPAETGDDHPAVTAFFESKDPFVREVVLPNIEANRKSDAVLQIVSADGQPLAGAKVSAELKKHEFLFGHCDLTTERDLARRKLLNDLFHYTCPGNETKWRAFAKGPEENDFTRVDAMLDFCRERDITLEWHFLSGYHPEWLASVTEDCEKARLQMENGRNVLKRYHDQVQFFQVINEDWLTHIGRAKVYADQTAWFTELRREFPTVELGVCDCWSYDVSLQLPSGATVSAPMSLGSNSTAFKLIWDEQTGTLRVMPASEATVNGPT